MHRRNVCSLVFVLEIFSVAALNILGVFPLTGESHFLAYEPILKELARRGHNVTVLGYFPPDGIIENYTYLTMGDKNYFEEAIEKSNVPNLSKIDDSRMLIYISFILLGFGGRMSCEYMFESENLKVFLKENRKYDLALTEYFASDCALGVINKFNCPVIRILSATMMPWGYHRFANPLNPAYIPNNFLPYSDEMTLMERVENTLLTVLQNMYYNYIEIHLNNRLVGTYFGESAETLESDIYKDSLMFINAHYTLNLPRPMVPNIIEIGGIHIGNNQLLQKDLEKWINDSKDGVIFFSLGSVIKGKTMPEDKKNAFLRAFKRLPQRVIWKWENDTMEGKSHNIRIGKWLPQFDILSHPNVKAFISHGGLLGTMEAVHSGTPMVIMPQFGDQHANAQAVAKAGGGVILYMSEATEETIYQALKTVLEPKFQNQMKELSERFRDRPMSPLDTAIYWVEYVARHKGAHFMKTAAVDMPFYQYYLLDVLAFIIFVMTVVSYIIYIIVSAVIKKVFGSSNRKPQTKQKKS